MFRKHPYLFRQTDDPVDARQQIVAFAKADTSARRNVWLRPALWLLALALWVVANVAVNSYVPVNDPMIPHDSPMVWVSIITAVMPVIAAALFMPKDFRRDRANLAYTNSLMDLSIFAGESDDFFVDYVNYSSHVESGTPYRARSGLDAEQVRRDFCEAVDQHCAALKKSSYWHLVVAIVAVLLSVALLDPQHYLPESPLSLGLLTELPLILNPCFILMLVMENALMHASTAMRDQRLFKAMCERADQGGYAAIFLRVATLRYRLTGFL